MDKQIQAGQWWRTKRGEVVHIVGQLTDGQWCVETKEGGVRFLRQDGSYTWEDCSLVEHLPWCKSFDCKEPPKPKKMESWCNVYSDNKAVFGAGWKTKEEAFNHRNTDCIRQAFVREVHTDEELESISQEITENTSGVFTAKCFSILKKHFGGPSE